MCIGQLFLITHFLNFHAGRSLLVIIIQLKFHNVHTDICQHNVELMYKKLSSCLSEQAENLV